jgi:hypothetical protein
LHKDERNEEYMEAFRAVSRIACFVGIVIAIMDALYPNEKFAKQIKIIFSLIFLLCIAKPIASGEIALPDKFISAEASTDRLSRTPDKTYDYFIKSVENNISTSLKEKLNEHEIIAEEILTSINISESNSISISEVEIVLSDSSDSQKAEEIIRNEAGKNVTVKFKEKEYAGTD